MEQAFPGQTADDRRSGEAAGQVGKDQDGGAVTASGEADAQDGGRALENPFDALRCGDAGQREEESSADRKEREAP